MITESPEGRHRKAAGQRRVAGDDLCRSLSDNEITIDIAAVGLNRDFCRVRFREVPALTKGAVEKYSGAEPVLDQQQEGDGDIHRLQTGMNAGGVSEHVDVPQLTGEPALVECAGGLAEAK